MREGTLQVFRFESDCTSDKLFVRTKSRWDDTKLSLGILAAESTGCLGSAECDAPDWFGKLTEGNDYFDTFSESGNDCNRSVYPSTLPVVTSQTLRLSCPAVHPRSHAGTLSAMSAGRSSPATSRGLSLDAVSMRVRRAPATATQTIPCTATSAFGPSRGSKRNAVQDYPSGTQSARRPSDWCSLPVVRDALRSQRSN